MNGRFASALDRPSGFCYGCSQGGKAEPCFPANIDLIVLRSFGVYTQFGIDPKITLHILKLLSISKTTVSLKAKRFMICMNSEKYIDMVMQL